MVKVPKRANDRSFKSEAVEKAGPSRNAKTLRQNVEKPTINQRHMKKRPQLTAAAPEREGKSATPRFAVKSAGEALFHGLINQIITS